LSTVNGWTRSTLTETKFSGISFVGVPSIAFVGCLENIRQRIQQTTGTNPQSLLLPGNYRSHSEFAFTRKLIEILSHQILLMTLFSSAVESVYEIAMRNES
jgi:hypothetical protein